MLEQLEELLEDPKFGSEDDTLGPLRLKILAAGLQAADLMSEHPDLASACIPMLISHMEIYAELVTIAQNQSVSIPDEEANLSMIINNTTQLGEA